MGVLGRFFVVYSLVCGSGIPFVGCDFMTVFMTLPKEGLVISQFMETQDWMVSIKYSFHVLNCVKIFFFFFISINKFVSGLILYCLIVDQCDSNLTILRKRNHRVRLKQCLLHCHLQTKRSSMDITTQCCVELGLKNYRQLPLFFHRAF